MSSVIDSIERAQVKKGLPSFDPGDRVRVHFQVIEGIVIKRQGSGARETFTVRKQSFGVGVERTFPLHSPKIEKLEIAARGDVRRAKLYYLRGRIGKAARVAERRWGIDEELISAPTAAEEPEAVDAEGVSQADEDAEAQAEVTETPPDETDEAAGPVAEDGESSSQAAGDSPSSTPPAAEADASDGEAPSAEAEVEMPEESAEAEASEEAAAEDSEKAKAESETDTEAEGEADQGTDAEAPEAGETEDNAVAEDAEEGSPDEQSGDSDEESA